METSKTRIFIALDEEVGEVVRDAGGLTEIVGNNYDTEASL